MFTGIIEKTGIIRDIIKEGSNVIFKIESELGPELKIDQSLAHNGVCLTVTEIQGNISSVTAVDETLKKTNLGDLQVGDIINLERAMASSGRFDGHVVQGHVDQVGTCTKVQELEGSWLYDFEYDFDLHHNVLVEKGSITINGVSLTCFDCENGSFRVTIIPYTHEHTNFKTLKAGDNINLEFDIIGKYVQRLMASGYQDFIKKNM
ncbi:riboflavin synthase [Aureibacter tunicatorum]|uniref:Riboflavin synthase n=1 Tax=Aureibacter tunicatorum TaxID=866807 RepID=A0AAE4BRE6_9BACT|nr:riboflavin synthase [Aureibacter tunicatorum]MDR6237700.1 riboflavin synthase [Aureibacter tunicatorum]BDD02735.1 riboflavin synthase subunit alpha [Aureibacter tunicatorum]